jgi:heme A synthase
MCRLIAAVFPATYFLMPLLALAATGRTDSIGDIIATATEIVTLAVPVAAILMLFFWSMFQIISNSGDAEKLKKARSKIMWGVIILFVIFSLGGILAVLRATFFGQQ